MSLFSPGRTTSRTAAYSSPRALVVLERLAQDVSAQEVQLGRALVPGVTRQQRPALVERFPEAAQPGQQLHQCHVDLGAQSADRKTAAVLAQARQRPRQIAQHLGQQAGLFVKRRLCHERVAGGEPPVAGDGVDCAFPLGEHRRAGLDRVIRWHHHPPQREPAPPMRTSDRRPGRWRPDGGRARRRRSPPLPTSSPPCPGGSPGRWCPGQ